jgi:hypothetical protein
MGTRHGVQIMSCRWEGVPECHDADRNGSCVLVVVRTE